MAFSATEFTPWAALIGGGLIGLASVLLLLLTGRIAGISGIAALATLFPGVVLWVSGLFLGAACYRFIFAR